ncbi:5-guanidino-2-oxopentanoate decarboxylase [Dasania sp. GY-MA-18]|uniref:5-guanidino-2-oxopentanoate decarboxylase n=1 Tax=Dasania phycosphaerae TaxID=2950436 RepID=A0A9J6RLZ8_9GAMM|nr:MULTISPECIES: 5-guanidino-2-oxopentanoate decarboxylase [Dasania]MCR8922971.1 5-guanidino-2-oxopentanoate decarboxylase [Dasania sp. GY-MA-18]MCZ0865402.1 5-guanidino-2-oxopentanoate decarboxylase [Dasania phycosphaerae]MCZ0869127.1 5-guanidino-2-oxopentanoate decarboxylase [Dasania phycosphaerae]
MATCGEQLIKLISAYGIDTAFGIPGTHTIELYRGLPQTPIRHVSPRHEQGAGFMADGYARVTGKPAVCITVSGPGGYNIGTAMGQAKQDSIPMLVISADNNSWEKGLGEGRLHETRNLQAAMAECSVWSHTLARPDELPKVIARAFAIFNSERPGPVHISMPLDVITANADHVDMELWPLPSRPAASPVQLQQAADLLNQAQNPVIALGGGAADAAELIRELATKIDAPVTTTHNAKGILPADHPLHVGSSPSYQPIRDLYQAADVILAIGTELAETDYDFFFNGQFSLGQAKLIRIDIEAAQLSRNARPEIAIQADAALASAALLPLINPAHRQGADRTATLRTQLKALDHPGYQRFLDSLQQALPKAVVIGDSTQPAYFAGAQYDAPQPRSFASAATGYGTLGHALPAAFGAKLAKPELPVVCLIGDGGLQFTINELASAVEAEIPVAVVIWNNQRYEMIAQNFEEAGMQPIACDIYTPDFLTIAQGYGCPAYRAENLESLIGHLQQAQQQNIPTIIEVMEKDFL